MKMFDIRLNEEQRAFQQMARDYLPYRRRVERVTLQGNLPFGANGSFYFLLDVESGEPTINVDNYQTAAVERKSKSKAS